MMRHTGFWVVVFCLLLLSAGALMAQDEETCPAIVQQALQAVDDLCALTGRNQVCYGHFLLSAAAREGVSASVLDSPGDMAGLSQIQSVQLYPMDPEAGTWGVALLRVQANIPDTLPGQNVTFLLFGDTELEPADLPNSLSVTINSPINLRRGPGTDFAVITTLAAGETVRAVRRSENGEWLLAALPGGGGGWLFASLVTVDGDISELETAANEARSTQAFYFRSGIGDAPCAVAPESGLLLHTPDGMGEVELFINEVLFVIGSTVYIRATPGGDMLVAVIEGHVTIFVAGVGVTIHAGESVRIPLDASGRPIGPASSPELLDPATLEPLPVIIVERDTGYAGMWQSLDVDGSTQTLRIWLADGAYQAEWYDDGASVCGRDSTGTPLYAGTFTGSATALETGGLVLNISGICEDGANTAVGPFAVPISYDAATDTLYDGTLTWTRISP